MFVFRNYTIENLFPEGTVFSGYDDISYIPAKEEELVWFYQAPIEFDTCLRATVVNGYREKLRLLISNIPHGKKLYILSLENLYPIRYTDMDSSLKDAITYFNTDAIELAKTNPNVKFIDFGEFLAYYPCNDWINWRFYFISQMIVNPNLAADFRQWWAKRIATAEGKRKKCIVLDLDNTLWGGVLGEDGIAGIKIGGEYPGNAFEYFQKGLIALGENGVILTVCSKNNEVDVKDAWEKNPFVKIKESQLAAWEINWDNKADNIRKLAKRLNIGLDSMVFVDDNPTERELIRQQLPMVEVPEFPKRPYDLPQFFSGLVDEYFRSYSLTNEDREKTAQYKANAMRAQEESHFTDITDFIKSLDIKIELQALNEFNLARIAQMTQKTNQFNLTTRRYTEADILGLKQRGAKVYCISVSDKFGDNGITGEIICNVTDKRADIDTLLLSCRILGKGIELAFVKSVLNTLREDGIEEVFATYIPTAKNGQVSDFYDKIGFELKEEKDGVKHYALCLDKNQEIENYYKIEYK